MGISDFLARIYFPERLSFRRDIFRAIGFGFRGKCSSPSFRHIVREDRRALLDLQEKARMGNDPAQRFWR